MLATIKDDQNASAGEEVQNLLNGIGASDPEANCRDDNLRDPFGVRDGAEIDKSNIVVTKLRSQTVRNGCRGCSFPDASGADDTYEPTFKEKFDQAVDNIVAADQQPGWWRHAAREPGRRGCGRQR